MVRWRLAFAACLGVTVLVACSAVRTVTTQSQEINDAKGTIQAVRPDAGWYAIVPDSDKGTRYAPESLADEFKKDGLRVIFSGRVKPVDPNVRMWGIPLELTRIRAER